MDCDPDTLLEWLQNGTEEGRDIQLIALEQLCMMLLMSDNVDRCFDRCPPRKFLPTLCHIFMDDSAPDSVLEVTARALTYYLDISSDCSRRIIVIDGAVKAICNRMATSDINSRTSKDLAEQCVKILELMCHREANSILKVGGLTYMLEFVHANHASIHRDTLQAALSVVTRLCAKADPADASLPNVFKTLSYLLKYEDALVSDSILRCFSSLSEKYVMKGLDPSPIAQYGLIEHLLSLLAHYGQNGTTTISSAAAANTVKPNSLAPPVYESVSSPSSLALKGSPVFSVTVSIISMLCRCSERMTMALLNCDMLFPALENMMNQKEEFCLNDSLWLSHLILKLLFERKDEASASKGGKGDEPNFTTANAISANANNASSSAANAVTKSGASDTSASGAVAFRHKLIDIIRKGDTAAFLEAMDSKYAVDLNLTDDVGQSLLNWASALGTPEMVEYLCKRGATLNRAGASSSLQFATRFGRSQTMKILLKYGACPSAFDNKTLIDMTIHPERDSGDGGADNLARESLMARMERAAVFHQGSPSFLFDDRLGVDLFSRFERAGSSFCASSRLVGDSSHDSDSDNVVMVPNPVYGSFPSVYLSKILPILVRLYLQCVTASVRRNTVELLKKSARCCPADVLKRLCVETDFGTNIVDALSFVIDPNENDATVINGLMIAKQLLLKHVDYFSERFFQFGLTEKIKQLMLTADNEKCSAASESFDASTDGAGVVENMLRDRLYRWRDWQLCGTSGSLFVWCDMCVIEFSSGSNGWFRYMVDDELYTMYSSGGPDTDAGSSYNRDLFVSRLREILSSSQASFMVSKTENKQPPVIDLFDGNRRSKALSGNWVIEAASDATDEITISNLDGSVQRTTIRNGVAGFVFRTKNSDEKTVVGKKPLKSDLFFTGWMQANGDTQKKNGDTATVSSTSKNKKQVLVADLAAGVYHSFLKRSCSTAHPYLDKLRAFTVEVRKAVSLYQDGSKLELRSSPDLNRVLELIKELKQLLSADNILSSSSLLSSGMVASLFLLLSCVQNHRQLWAAFAQSFLTSADGNQDHCAYTTVVRKMVHVLECYEKLPLYLYDVTSLNAGLSRRFKMMLERAPHEQSLLDKTGKRLKVESLVKVADIRQHVRNLTVDRWYNHDRRTFEFVRYFVDGHGRPLTFEYDHGDSGEDPNERDGGGILAWVGTNGDNYSRWCNPAKFRLIRVMCSEGSFSFDKTEDFFKRDYATAGPHNHDNRKSWICIDLGLNVIPTAYTLCHSRGSCRLPLGSWLFQMSSDCFNWISLHEHCDESVPNEPGTFTTYSVKTPKSEHVGWRYVLIKHGGRNANSSSPHCLAISGFEIFGTVTSAFTDFTFVHKDSGSRACRRTTGRSRMHRSCLPPTSKKVITKWRERRNLRHVDEQILPELERVGEDNSMENFTDVGEEKELFICSKDRRPFRKVQQDPGALVSKKSMSATNLFDPSYAADGGGLVSSTNQVASAESLQHPTASMENLLMRSRLREDVSATLVEKASSDCSSASEITTSPSSMVGGISGSKPEYETRQDLSVEPSEKAEKTSKKRAPSYAFAVDTSRPHRSRRSDYSVRLMKNLSDNLLHEVVEESEQLGACTSKKSFLVKSSNASQASTATLGTDSERDAVFLPGTSSSHGCVTAGQQRVVQVFLDSAAGSSKAVTNSVTTDILDPLNSASSLSDPNFLNANSERKFGLWNLLVPDKAAATGGVRGTTGSADGGSHGQAGGNSSASLDGSRPHTSAEVVSTPVNIAAASQDGNAELDGYSRLLLSRSWLKKAAKKQVKPAGASGEGKSWSAAARSGNLREAVAAVMQFLSNSSDSESDFYFDGAAADYAIARQLFTEMEDDEDIMAAAIDDDHEDDTDMDIEEEDSSMIDDVTGSSGVTALGLGAADFAYFTPLSLGYDLCYDTNCNNDSVIRRSYSSLLPAFDPRPGRTNINQMQDITLPEEENCEDRAGDVSRKSASSEDEEEEEIEDDEVGAKDHIRLRLSCQRSAVTSAPGGACSLNVSVPLTKDDKSIFYYVQKLVQYQRNGLGASGKVDSSVRIWDMIYTLRYGQVEEEASGERSAAVVAGVDESTVSNGDVPFGITKEEYSTLVLVLEILRLLLSLYNNIKAAGLCSADGDNITAEFLSKKLAQKVAQQLNDSLVVCTLSLPDWCDWLMLNYPFLFTFDARNTYFHATALGTSRSTVWLQKQLEQQMELQRGKLSAHQMGTHRHESQVGRIKHEKIKILRKPSILPEAIRIMEFHARNKSILEVEFEHEEGTGLGPTLEFYALIAAELQKKSLGIWLSDDDDRDMPNANGQLSADGGYIMRSGGLFPAPLPQNSTHCDEACRLFHFLGIVLAKVLQDQHLIDLPLSLPFVKLMCCQHRPCFSDSGVPNQRVPASSPKTAPVDQWSVKGALSNTGSSPLSWCRKCLSLEDLEVVTPVQAKVFQQLRDVCQRRRQILDGQNMSDDAKSTAVSNLRLSNHLDDCGVEDLGLTFEVNASSRYYDYQSVQLKPYGMDIDVTADNVEEYISLCEEYFLDIGIRRQMNAFRLGFSLVFPIEKLRCFSPIELLTLMCGDQSPKWSAEDILNYTEPKLGYTKESRGFLNLVEVLCEMNGDERKAFLQFITGCSSLPPGGLANLYPRLTIVKKVDATNGTYPSVNTCVHYLKLPEYSSKEVLREKLLAATVERGFFLN